MQTESIELLCTAPGTRQTLTVHRFGIPGASPKVYLQGALHADEVPAILVMHQLMGKLRTLEAAGSILGEVILVPCANPLGLAQVCLGQHQGRFDLHDGRNFNRGFATLANAVLAQLPTGLGADPAGNVSVLRGALRQAAASLPAADATQDLKRQLLRLAVDADIVLDLHCDSDAVMHLYALTPQADMATDLGACLGARALLLATESGDAPFDEACSRTWLTLRDALPQFPVPLACFAATVELRGEADTRHDLAEQDALALCRFLAGRGALRLAPQGPDLAPLFTATPLAASEPITAPHAGVVVFRRRPGDRVAAGEAIADLVRADTGDITTLSSAHGGLLYARCGSRWATPGKRLAKVAGTALVRSGELLSP